MQLRMKAVCFAMLAAVVFVAGSYGQTHTLSRVRPIGTNQEVLDLTISMKHRRLSQITSDLELRNLYEEIIGYWADATYEMTNGGHKLGRIRIFTGSSFSGKADVQWIRVEDNISAYPNGFMSHDPGESIYMGDIFGNYNFLFGGYGVNGLKNAGYTLAHEIGHYVYGLYDEYVGDETEPDVPFYIPQPDDIGIIPSIMNSQWEAVREGNQWLNFSTLNAYNTSGSNFSRTAQGRAHGAAAWDVLIRDPSSDPARTIETWGMRKQYDVLVGRRPTAIPWIKIELPDDSARDSLQIIWMSDTVAIDLVLDISGSMEGAPIEDMKNAVKALVNAIDIFSRNLPIVPAIGITTFSTFASSVFPITVLNSSSIDQIETIVDSLIADGVTAMYDACIISHDKLVQTFPINSNRLTILFTDGEENASIEKNSANVVRRFTDHNIPIHVFGYGSGWGHDNCRLLSTGTDGRFEAYSTGSNMNDAWINIFSDVVDLQYLTNTTFSVASGLNFIVDPTVHSSIIEVRYILNDTTNSQPTVTIVDPNGMHIPSTTEVIRFNNSLPQERIAFISVDSSAVAGANLGQWTLNFNSAGLASTSFNGKVRIKGKPEMAYITNTGNHQNGFYEWPQPLRFSASTAGIGGLITGLNLTATLTSPSGMVTSVVLNDNGINGDRIANDGIYFLDYSNYTENGQYTLSVQFDNSAGNAYYAIEGVCPSIPYSGILTPRDTVWVTDNFVRVKNTVFYVTGVDLPEPTRTGAIMGFESDSLWYIIHSSGTLSSSTIRTEGSASLQILGNGWQQIKSIDVNTGDLHNIADKLSVDLYVGDTQTNPYWTGQVQLYINCPSANVHNQYIGHIDLTGLPLDRFSTLSFTLPQSIVNILNGNHSDFSFSLSINTNANTGAYYFDNMRFGN